MVDGRWLPTSDSGGGAALDPGEVGRLAHSVRGRVREHVPLGPLTTFCIGGPARVLVEPADEGDVVAVLSFCRSTGAALYVLGGGSNVLVPDEGVEGIVLRMAGALEGLSFEDGLIVAEAGVDDGRLSEFAAERHVSGLEWIFDIPGTVGGAVYMNAGNNDGEMKNGLERVRWVEPDGRIVESGGDGLEMGYRATRFQRQPGIVVRCWVRPAGQDSRDAIRGRMEAIRDLRRQKFPEEKRCAGSVFKRPPGHFAGRLIEEAGCGGMRVGGAVVSPKHKGFIVNTGGATARDVLQLIELVRAAVLANSGVRLETEVLDFGRLRFPVPQGR
jgi:UDP-N-acetylmuramate dehydrogenase